MICIKETVIFINRKAELEPLSGLYSSNGAEIFVLYGRRRVGKTELLRTFCAGKSHIFFIATLSQQIWEFDHPETPDGFTFPSWEAAFRAPVDRKCTIVAPWPPLLRPLLPEIFP
jgi:AAA+ ATPase superfamily predicted ATPase